MDTRTNIVLDDELVARAMAKAGVTTKKAAIEVALRAYVREPDWAGLLSLEGAGLIADDYDRHAGLPAVVHFVAQDRAGHKAPGAGGDR